MAANFIPMKEKIMKKLTCDDFSDGFPTDHRIRFRSRRTLVEGGYKLGSDDSVIEYDGLLFESNHSDTHLCVKVDHEDHWGRSRDWHGYIHRDNVLEVVLVDDAEPFADEFLELIADKQFLFAWGKCCNKAVAGESPA